MTKSYRSTLIIMFFILDALFFIIYRFYSNFIENYAPKKQFCPEIQIYIKSWQKIKRISDLSTLIFFGTSS